MICQRKTQTEDKSRVREGGEEVEKFRKGGGGVERSARDFECNRSGYSSSTHYSRYGAEAEVYGVDGYSP